VVGQQCGVEIIKTTEFLDQSRFAASQAGGDLAWICTFSEFKERAYWFEHESVIVFFNGY
jgi:hypothetical protein